jgi:hypothetical protein
LVSCEVLQGALVDPPESSCSLWFAGVQTDWEAESGAKSFGIKFIL